MIRESLDLSIFKNSQYIRSEITKGAIDKKFKIFSIFILGTVEFKLQNLISDSYSHSHKAVSVWGENHKIYFF